MFVCEIGFQSQSLKHRFPTGVCALKRSWRVCEVARKFVLVNMYLSVELAIFSQSAYFKRLLKKMDVRFTFIYN